MGAQVSGVKAVLRNARRFRKAETKASAAALKKVATTARGRVRRAIAGEEGIPLKTTRNRVQWYWKGGLLGGARIKFWVGTGVPVLPSEAASIDRPRDITDTAERVVPDLVGEVHRRRFPVELRSQLRRFYRL